MESVATCAVDSECETLCSILRIRTACLGRQRAKKQSERATDAPRMAQGCSADNLWLLWTKQKASGTCKSGSEIVSMSSSGTNSESERLQPCSLGSFVQEQNWPCLWVKTTARVPEKERRVVATRPPPTPQLAVRVKGQNPAPVGMDEPYDY